MNTSDLCLGALFFGDASGYEIKQRFETTFSHFQRASFGAIYPALSKLEKEGLVSARIEVQEKRPDKKVFSLTAAGRQHFVDSLQHTEPTESCRSDFILLMFFADYLTPEKLQSVLQKQEAELQKTLDILKQIKSAYPHSPGQAFTLDFGIHMKTAALDYLRRHQATIRKTED